MRQHDAAFDAAAAASRRRRAPRDMISANHVIFAAIFDTPFMFS